MTGYTVTGEYQRRGELTEDVRLYRVSAAALTAGDDSLERGRGHNPSSCLAGSSLSRTMRLISRFTR